EPCKRARWKIICGASLRSYGEDCPYAEILASQGLLTTAMKYLKVLDSSGFSPELSILRDRISLTAEPETNTPASGTQLQSTIPYNQGSFFCSLQLLYIGA
ncbi:unnamed protein product, partial [Eruca vesicaria subsp. sativa]|nr:unnamed protein product [Eruca vesicaria subsp. sativa]